MTLKIDAKFEENLICCFKTDKDLVNFVPSTQKSLKFTLWFVPSVIIMFHLKKHIGVIFHDTESDIKFGGKLTYGLENSMRNLANFHHSTWKLGLRIGTFMGTFIPSRKCINLKFAGKLIVMTMKKDAKFGKELTSSQLTWGI